MRRPLFLFLAAAGVLFGLGLSLSGRPQSPIAASSSTAAVFTPDHQLRFPQDYREWVYLTSGLDMTYTAETGVPNHSVFDNVFVDPASYHTFLQSGHWPEGTMLVLENRGAVHGGVAAASINKAGMTQSAELTGLEVHVRDASLPGGWGFFSFDAPTTAKLITRPASCYTCHEQHAAVDTTFVQFYPTLLGIAKVKGTLSKAYTAELAAPTH